jgi:hypothetical protein
MDSRLCRRGIDFLCLLLTTFFLFGCSQSTTTNPTRSATEQLLLSTAADRALKTIDFSSFAGKKVFVDASYLDSYDSRYVIGTVRDLLSRNRALLVSELAESDVVVEARSGVLSIDASDSLIGIPQTGAPVPLGGALSIPELALYKASRQNSLAKLALLAYETKSHAHFLSSEPLPGRAYNRYYKILGVIKWTATDLPEKKRKSKNKFKETPPTTVSTNHWNDSTK